MRGAFDISKLVQEENKQAESIILALEGLRPNTNYRLLIYLKKLISTKYHHSSSLLSQVQLILNQTLITPSKDMTHESKPTAFYDEYYDEEDEEDYLDDPSSYDDYTDTLNKKNDRVISCDLFRQAAPVSTSTLSPNSLFSLNNKNRKKFTNQFLTINYSSNNMNKLLMTAINSSLINNNEDLSEISSNFSYFKDFFNLKQFSKESGMDYSVNFDCLKQYERNSKQAAFLLNRPLCLFNLEGDQYGSVNEENEDYFSVHTSIKFENAKLLKALKSPKEHFYVHVASSCHKKRTTNKISAYFNADKPLVTFQSLKQIPLSKFNSSTVANVISKNKSAHNPEVMTPFAIQTTTHTLFTFKRTNQHHILDTLTINDCFIISDQELQFRIDHDSFVKNNLQTKSSLLLNNFLSDSSKNEQIDYEIELIMPMINEANEEIMTGRDMKRSKLTQSNYRNRPKVFNFTLKKINQTQVN